MSKLPLCKQILGGKMAKLKKQLFWNLVINSISSSYIAIAFAFLIYVQVNITESKTNDTTFIVISVMYSLFLVMCPFMSALTLWRKGDLLVTDTTLSDKIGGYYKDINVKRSTYSRYYNCIFLLRRLMIIVIPIVFMNLPTQ